VERGRERGRETVQTAVRLPREMHEKLKQSPVGVSEEIRQRLERSLNDDAIDPETRELAAAVINLAEKIRPLAGSAWHQHRHVRAALTEAISTWMQGIQPDTIADATHDLLGFWKADDPQTVGRTIARQELLNRVNQSKRGKS